LFIKGKHWTHLVQDGNKSQDLNKRTFLAQDGKKWQYLVNEVL